MICLGEVGTTHERVKAVVLCEVKNSTNAKFSYSLCLFKVRVSIYVYILLCFLRW